jgi:hypothetical protein
MMFGKLFAVLSIAVAVGVALEAPLPGYGVEEVLWQVQSHPGKPHITLNGTVEEVYSQLLEINPNYETDFGTIDQRVERLKRDDYPVEVTTPRDLTKRDNTVCWNFQATIVWPINSGITYLRGVPGQPTNGPGPGNCGRVSCSYESAIWWCNDNPTPKTLPSFNTIADAAQTILNDCITWKSIGISGQRFHDDKWNAVVTGDNC